MSEVFDLVVVGGGPGGIAATVTAAEAGKRVCLVDDNPEPGGQIWRSSVIGAGKNGEAAKWLRRIDSDRVVVRSGWRAVGASGVRQSPGTLVVEREGRCEELQYSALILATGARELFLPFPGWTLPGVYGAGGLQAFVKSGLDISGKRVVIAGTGPLLLAVAAALRKTGARVVAVVEQVPLSRLARFSLGLIAGHAGKLIEGAGYGLSCLGVPYYMNGWVTSAVGGERLAGVSVRVGGRAFEIEADMLAIGFHLVPNIELAQLLHCELENGYVRIDAMQRTSVQGIYCIGEATGIGGVDKAQVEGRIAALTAVGLTGQANTLMNASDRQRRFVRRLADTFKLRDELRGLASVDTLVCRCEDVSHGRLLTCTSWREAKLHTRCGMGPCQGRVCGAAAQFLYGWDLPEPRPPLFPVHVATLGRLQVPDENVEETISAEK